MHWNGVLYYLLSDGLGSSTVALKDDGTTQAAQLFAPYGAVRHSSGTMPTTYNFTGQRLDSETGLLYYNFRYYDPVSGRFVRADTVQNNAGGKYPYAYVGDSPENGTDPTGHRYADVVTDGLNYTTTAILILSSVYGGLSSNAHVQIRFFQEYITDPKNADPMVRSYVNERTRPSTVDKRVRDAEVTVEEFEDSAKKLELYGNVLLGVGALVDGISSGLQYYDQHKNQGVGAAIGVGVVHALLSTAGTIIGAAAGEDLGGAIGTLLIPIPGVGTIIGATIGGVIGGAAGGYVGDQLASAWEPAAASVGSAVASGLGSASAWVGSLF